MKEVSVRIRCAGFLALVTAVLVGIVLVPAAIATSSSPASGSTYPWVQPWAIGGTVPDVGHWTQPSASVPLTIPAERPVTVRGLHASYRWVQPWGIRGGAAPEARHWTQPPASVPAG